MSVADPQHLDHIVLAGPSLAEAVAWFADLTGVRAAPGGSHPGWGTANALVGLGGGAYLEIIGPDPDQPGPPYARPFRVDELAAPRLVGWAIHPPDLYARVRAARERGHDPGEPREMSRRTADGETLRWRLTDPESARHGDVAVLPFLIDWGATPQPSTRGLPVAALVDFRGRHPDPGHTSTLLAALGTDLAIAPGDAALELVLDSPAGAVRIP